MNPFRTRIGPLPGIVLLLTVSIAAAQATPHAISIRGDGTLVIQGSAEVPPCDAIGQWSELDARSSARYAVRHFLFTVPSGPPAMELYVAHNLADEPPDGAFEIGLVSGFLSGFSSKGGLTHTAPVFSEVMIGEAHVKRGRAELAKGATRFSFYAYMFVRQPSLTFLTFRPRADASGSIEAYLSTVRLR